MSKSKIVCVDFDGTCVMHEYPKIGEDVPNVVAVLKKLNEKQVKLILWTIRSGKIRSKDSGRNRQRLTLQFILTMLRSAVL